jgi:hypothetical protein
MKNWISSITGDIINLDYCTQIYVRQVEGKFHVIADIREQDAAFMISEGYADQESAKKHLARIIAVLATHI